MSAAFYRNFQPEDLPVPDHQVIRLIQSTLDESVEIEQLGHMVATNPGLTSQLLGMVNSAFFGCGRSINTISEAIVTLGLDQLRHLVLCFSVKEALSRTQIPGFDINAFWEDSLRRGVAARHIGKLVNEPAEEAFTAGMLQDIGLLVLFSLEPDKADRYPLLRSNLPDRRHEMEEELFHTSHDIVGALLAREWNLPDIYIRSISTHHEILSSRQLKDDKKDNRHTRLSAMMLLADLCNAIYTCHDKTRALETLKKKAGSFFKLSPEKVETVLSLLPAQVAEISRAFSISVNSQLDFNTVMDQANRRLVEDNISYQELTWQLQKSLKQRDEYAARLEAELDIAREIQKSLQPDIEKIDQVCAFNLPAYHLSGDFYDYFEKENGTICFCLGDVSGKGTSAALLMAKAISLFRCLCKVLDDISQIVYLMNNELYETAIRGMFVTFVGGWLNPSTRDVHLINVGHLPPFLITDKKVLRIHPASPPLGVMPDSVYDVKTFSLAASRLYLYTDGFTEGRLKTTKTKEIGAELGLDGFLRWLVQSRKMRVDEQTDYIKEQCSRQLQPQSDDLTLMILSGES